MMKKRLLFGFVFATVLLSSCDDTTETLGNTLTSSADLLDLSDTTFNVSTRSIIVDSVLSKSTYSYLGHIKDPETGIYIKSNYMSQFSVLESLDGSSLLPNEADIISRKNGKVIADSCQLQIYFYSSVGDSLNPMRLTVHEMEKPMREDTTYYTNYSPKDLLRKDNDAIKINKLYTTVDLTLKDSLRGQIVDKTNMESVFIPLNSKYKDKNGNEYENYGTYIIQMYYSHPEYFKNAYTFIHNVCPGFYIESSDGLGVMSEVYLTELAIYYKYKDEDNETQGSLLLSGTKEVLQTTNIINDRNAIARCVADNSCTYLNTPAGIFTEVTLPIDKIYSGHERDNISSAKIAFNHLNTKDPSFVPNYILMLPKDDMYKFFENNELPDSKKSYMATYSSSNNTYTFNNISMLISSMYEAKLNGTATENWNKVVLVPIAITTNSTSSSSSSAITNISNEMLLKSVRLVGGEANQRQPVTISIIYNKFGE